MSNPDLIGLKKPNVLSQLSDVQIKINALQKKITENPTDVTLTMLSVINKLKSYADKQTRKGTQLNIYKSAGALKAIVALVKLTDDYHDTNNKQPFGFTDAAITIIESNRAQIASSRFIDWIRKKLSSIFSVRKTQSANSSSKDNDSLNKKRKRYSLFATEGSKITTDAKDSILAIKKQLLSSAQILSLTTTTSLSTSAAIISNVLEPSSSTSTTIATKSTKTGPAVYFVKELPNEIELRKEQYKNSYIITENNTYKDTISYISTDNIQTGPFLISGLSEFKKKTQLDKITPTDFLTEEQANALRYYLVNTQRKELELDLLKIANYPSHEASTFRYYIRESLINNLLPEKIISYFNREKVKIAPIPTTAETLNTSIEIYRKFNDNHGQFIAAYEHKIKQDDEKRALITNRTSIEDDLNDGNRPANYPEMKLPNSR